jgi:hypothetical protein
MRTMTNGPNATDTLECKLPFCEIQVLGGVTATVGTTS